MVVHVSAQSRTKQFSILEAAIECIADRGCSGTRLADVSRVAGVSIGVIQHHFGSRDQLILAALNHAADELRSEMSSFASSTSSGWEQLMALLQHVAHMPQLVQRGSLWLEISRIARQQPAYSEALEAVYRLWVDLINGAIERGQLDGSIRKTTTVEQQTLVTVLLAFIDGYEYQLASHLVPSHPEHFIEAAQLCATRLLHP